MSLSRDAIAGAISIALALGYWLVADGIPRSLLSDAVGADGIPKALAVVLGVLGLSLLWRGLRRREERTEEPDWRAHLRAAGLLAIGIAYVVFMPWIGFAAATGIVIVVVAAYSGATLGRNLVLIGAVSGIAFWFVFAKLLSVSVPPGFWIGS
jgi:putative tricarboxylic transport membrane protein